MPKIPEGVRGAVITGWGSALPPKVLTNKDLEGMFETSDDWIIERTGIRERHVGGTTAGLSIESGRKALDMAGIDPSEIDALILATPPPTAQCRQHRPPFNTNSACAAERPTSMRRARASCTA